MFIATGATVLSPAQRSRQERHYFRRTLPSFALALENSYCGGLI
jgi:hypothetical protein